MSPAADRSTGLATSFPTVGTTFVLLVQIRILMIGVTVLFDANVRGDFRALAVLAFMGVASGAAAVAWKRVVPWLLDHPTLLGFDVLIGYTVLAVGKILGPYFLLTVVTAAIAGLLYRWQAVALLCVQQIVLYYVVVSENGLPEGMRVSGFLLLVGLPAFYPIGALVGAMLRRLFDEHAAVEEARWRVETMAAAAAERSRLAREMHDSLASKLSAISLSAMALPAWARKAPERVDEEARRIASVASLASREARTLIAELRDDTVLQPLGTAIRRAVDDWARASGVPARAVITAEPDLPLPVRHEAVAMVKEALENVGRHAVATSVDVRVSRYGERLEIGVHDDGRGFPTPPGDDGWLDALTRAGHYGIVGMHERAERAGGRLTVTSSPGMGSTVTMSLPLTDGGAGPGAGR
ncbi:sensor histidine kinase [Actinoallomurus oryzae]